MLRRLYPNQPDSFAFTPANQAWAEAQISKYPEGRQASAIIPLLWRAQEQEGWLTRPAIEHVAEMLDMAYIRALEVATFYFMFQLQPVGSVAHIQICGTTSCMICGAEDLMAVCKDKIAANPHELSADGKFSWEEVECLGACANAPMAQIGKDYYEDLTTERMAEIIDELARGEVPVPGPQNGRYASEPLAGLTSLPEYESGHTKYNASVQLAVDLGDTVKRIDGTEVPLVTPWRDASEGQQPPKTRDDLLQPGGLPDQKPTEGKQPSKDAPADASGMTKQAARDEEHGRPVEGEPAQAAEDEGPADPDRPMKPEGLVSPRAGQSDDLKRITGVGPKVEKMLNEMGCYHYDQIAAWSPQHVSWVDQNLKGFRGRATRDDWVSQARQLCGADAQEDEDKNEDNDTGQS
jgi:NADH-quinone oxidoreductase subunit E